MAPSSGPIFQVFASSSWGGGEQFVHDLSRRLADDGRPVVLLHRPSRVIGERVGKLGLPVHVLPFGGAADLVSALMLARLVMRYRPSVIHLHHFKDLFTVRYALALCRRLGVRPRVVVTRHLVRCGRRGWLYRQLYRQIDRLVFVSDLARREFLSTQPPIAERKISVIRNSVAEMPVERGVQAPLPDLRAEYRLPAEVPILLFCGRCVAEKGCDVLLRACGALGERPYALFFVGATDDKEYVARLDRMVGELNLTDKVRFLGYLDGANRLLRQADVSVSPSVCAEAGSLTVLEAMQAGCALVASDNGSQPEYVDDGETGLLVPPGDAGALAGALCRLLDDPGFRRRLGEAARRKFVDELSYEIFYASYRRLYE